MAARPIIPSERANIVRNIASSLMVSSTRPGPAASTTLEDPGPFHPAPGFRGIPASPYGLDTYREIDYRGRHAGTRKHGERDSRRGGYRAAEGAGASSLHPGDPLDQRRRHDGDDRLGMGDL